MSSTASQDPALRLELQFAVSPESWGKVERVREAVDRCIALVYDESDARDAVAMAAAELMENAIKYGRTDDNNVALTLREEGGMIVLGVTSRLVDGSRGEAVAASMAEIAAFPSPAEAYMNALAKMAAVEPDATTPAKSGLGLVRIAYEGGFALSMQVDGDRLTICARRPQ